MQRGSSADQKHVLTWLKKLFQRFNLADESYVTAVNVTDEFERITGEPIDRKQYLSLCVASTVLTCIVRAQQPPSFGDLEKLTKLSRCDIQTAITEMIHRVGPLFADTPRGILLPRWAELHDVTLVKKYASSPRIGEGVYGRVVKYNDQAIKLTHSRVWKSGINEIIMNAHIGDLTGWCVLPCERDDEDIYYDVYMSSRCGDMNLSQF